MRFYSIRNIAAGIGFAALLSVGWHADAQQPPTETVTVSKTGNLAPFDYRIRLLADRAQFRVYRLTYPSPVVTPLVQNNTVPADYYVPKNLQPGVKYPAAICLHILDGNEALTDLVCSVLAGRGVPAISFKLPYYGERGGPKGPEILADDPKLFVAAIAQAGEDIRRTVDLLASRPEINPQRIGITGISLGGIIAATAAGAEPRLYRAGLILAGGDLLTIIHHARETRPLSEMIQELPSAQRAEVEAKLAMADPLHYASALRDRAEQGRVLMINAGEDEVIPRQCTAKLAEALGIADRVNWLDGLGHYTAMAELPRALRMTAEFFAQDLPGGTGATTALGTEVPSPRAANAQGREMPSPRKSALERLASVVEQVVTMLITEPESGRCHFVDLEVSAELSGHWTARVRMVRGAQGRFLLRCQLPVVGEVALGQNRYPWLLAGGKTLFAGTKNAVANRDALAYVEPRHLMRLRMAAGLAGAIVLAPEMLQQWIAVEDDKTAAGDSWGGSSTATPTSKAATGGGIRITARDKATYPGEIRLCLADDGRTPAAATFAVAGVQGKLDFHGWQTNTIAPDALFEPPPGAEQHEVEQSDVHRMMAAMANFAAERLDDGRRFDDTAMTVLARDPAGHGLLCRNQGKLILMLSGTPPQMGTAHGTLLRPILPKQTGRVVYLMGAADTLRSGTWFFDRMAEIERRTLPHIPPRFVEECDALSKAAGVSDRDGRLANLFPERFHCSGVALRGKATVGGRVLHARVLDYMTEIDLQDSAAVTVFMPDGRYKWMSLGYAGFVGTVTAMNEKGLAIGEMGGRGEGRWDGMPMTFLLRDVMERAATVAEAIEIIRHAPRTCEYYYVVSDKSGDRRGLKCTPEKMTVLEPGQQHPLLPHVPADTVLISADDRAKLLSRRIEEKYGRIDVAQLIEIIKHPVAMQGNLHDAIFAPETLEMWFSDAGKHTRACDEPYAHANLRELIQFYAEQANRAHK